MPRYPVTWIVEVSGFVGLSAIIPRTAQRTLSCPLWGCSNVFPLKPLRFVFVIAEYLLGSESSNVHLSAASNPTTKSSAFDVVLYTLDSNSAGNTFQCLIEDAVAYFACTNQPLGLLHSGLRLALDPCIAESRTLRIPYRNGNGVTFFT